jgi:hypothetical protein
MMLNLQDVLLDVSAFADDADDVVVEDGGRVLYVKNGLDVECRILPEDGSLPDRVRMPGGTELPYTKFLTHELARLDVLATKLVDQRPAVPFFVDGEASLTRPGDQALQAKSVALLDAECRDAPAFASRVSFLTADAGHGKTALLRHYQREIALAFQKGMSSFLFWHVDLQGRQLLRLSEALMGDLGELRHAGLWMPGIVRLMQRKKLILAVDGFDELSAEQGDADALGALTSLVEQLEGRGVIIAAARRTFFDAEDYASKTSLVRRGLASPCYFDQMQLAPWGKLEAVRFLETAVFDGQSFPEPEVTYEGIVKALGGDNEHPMLERPFLLSQMAKVLLTSQLAPEDFVTTDGDPMSGVSSVVHAFIKREVTEKWIFPDTGAPYLTQEQHVELLASVAEEMYRSQKDRLRLDTIETIAAMLMDQWSIAPSRQAQIMDMVRAHVLLVLPPDEQPNFRSFDHPEFRDFFVAQALRGHLETALANGDARQLARFLTYAPLTDGTARYVCAMVDRSPVGVDQAVRSLCDQVRAEWRPTHLQPNAGTLVASLLDRVDFGEEVVVEAALVVSSLVLERSKLRKVRFTGVNFVNLSLQHADWTDVVLSGCEVTELRLDRSSSRFSNVMIEDTRISCVKVALDGEEDEREYSPRRIRLLLNSMGIASASQEPMIEAPSVIEESDSIRTGRRLFSLFARSTTVTDHMIESRFRGAGTATFVLNTVVPLLTRHDLIEEKPWRGAGSGRAWMLRRTLDEILSAVDRPNDPAHAFWRELSEA